WSCATAPRTPPATTSAGSNGGWTSSSRPSGRHDAGRAEPASARRLDHDHLAASGLERGLGGERTRVAGVKQKRVPAGRSGLAAGQPPRTVPPALRQQRHGDSFGEDLDGPRDAVSAAVPTPSAAPIAEAVLDHPQRIGHL